MISGFQLTSPACFLGAIGVFLIERQFFRAALWSLAAAVLSSVGLIHAYELAPGGVTTRFGLLAAPEFVVSYLLMCALFLALGWWEKRQK